MFVVMRFVRKEISGVYDFVVTRVRGVIEEAEKNTFQAQRPRDGGK